MDSFPRFAGSDVSIVEEQGLAGKTLFAFVSIVNAAARPLSWSVRKWIAKQFRG
jgi:hypothetical protein